MSRHTYTEPYNRSRVTPIAYMHNGRQYKKYHKSGLPYLNNALSDRHRRIPHYLVPEVTVPLEEFQVFPSSPVLAALYRFYAPDFVPTLFIRTRRMFHSNHPELPHPSFVLSSSCEEHLPWGPQAESLRCAVVTVPPRFQESLQKIFFSELFKQLSRLDLPFTEIPSNFAVHVNISSKNHFAELFGIPHHQFRAILSLYQVQFPTNSFVINISYEPRYQQFVFYYGNNRAFHNYFLDDPTFILPPVNSMLKSALPSIDFVLPPKPHILSPKRS